MVNYPCALCTKETAKLEASDNATWILTLKNKMASHLSPHTPGRPSWLSNPGSDPGTDLSWVLSGHFLPSCCRARCSDVTSCLFLGADDTLCSSKSSWDPCWVCLSLRRLFPLASSGCCPLTSVLPWGHASSHFSDDITQRWPRSWDQNRVFWHWTLSPGNRTSSQTMWPLVKMNGSVESVSRRKSNTKCF